jgi:hypothetical protein
MSKINIALCIPTMDRFDNFLEKYLKIYIEYLKNGIISEIVICDENGNDYEKISNKYGYIINNINFKIFKNDSVLGVFKNKIKVCSLSTSKYIALIDSDNFCDKNYFLTATNYINEKENSFSNNIVLSPSFAKPNFNYKYFENSIVNKSNLKEYFDNSNFQILLNTGNYILNRSIIENINYDKSLLYNNISACDVLFFNLLLFQQFDDLNIHIIKDLEYDHIIHSGSIYSNTIHNCQQYINDFVMPSYRNLMNK